MLKSKEPDRNSTVSLARQLPTTPKKNTDGMVKKIAVTMPDKPSQSAQFIEFDQVIKSCFFN